MHTNDLKSIQKAYSKCSAKVLANHCYFILFEKNSILVSISSACCPCISGNTYPRSGYQSGNIAQHSVVGWNEKKALQSRGTDCVLARIRNCRPFVHCPPQIAKVNKRSSFENKQQTEFSIVLKDLQPCYYHSELAWTWKLFLCLFAIK